MPDFLQSHWFSSPPTLFNVPSLGHALMFFLLHQEFPGACMTCCYADVLWSWIREILFLKSIQDIVTCNNIGLDLEQLKGMAGLCFCICLGKIGETKNGSTFMMILIHSLKISLVHHHSSISINRINIISPSLSLSPLSSS